MAPTTPSFFLYIAITCIMLTKSSTFYLPMIPIDSPKLQIMPQSLTSKEHLQFLMNISMARASSQFIRGFSSKNTNSIETTMYSMPIGYYVTQLFLGTASLSSPYLILDTGDSKTWMQCDGCKTCFELKGGGVKAQQSSTYRLLSPNDSRCKPRLVYHWACGYKSNYGIGRSASTTGPMATDTFTFINSQTKLPERIPNISFGCGMENKNFSWGGPNNLIAGVFGISPSPRSFLNQLDTTIQGRFSYCLTSWAEPYQGMSAIHFGASAKILGPNVKEISMDASRRYHLYFRGISVDGKRVPLNSSICDLDYNIPKGFFIDSGATATVLPESVYQPLRDVMVSYFGRYGWRPSVEGPFDLCYASNGTMPIIRDQSLPSVIFHFKGIGESGEIDWIMGGLNMFVRFTGHFDGLCMAVYENTKSSVCLFGAYQQANFRILYDVRNSVLSFAKERCQENRP